MTTRPMVQFERGIAAAMHETHGTDQLRVNPANVNPQWWCDETWNCAN
jgi:hypothetical protein